jgi:hypothetical protein
MEGDLLFTLKINLKCLKPLQCIRNTKDRQQWKACVYINAVELHLSGLDGTASHPDMQENPDNWVLL